MNAKNEVEYKQRKTRPSLLFAIKTNFQLLWHTDQLDTIHTLNRRLGISKILKFHYTPAFGSTIWSTLYTSWNDWSNMTKECNEMWVFIDGQSEFADVDCRPSFGFFDCTDIASIKTTLFTYKARVYRGSGGVVGCLCLPQGDDQQWQIHSSLQLPAWHLPPIKTWRLKTHVIFHTYLWRDCSWLHERERIIAWYPLHQSPRLSCQHTHELYRHWDYRSYYDQDVSVLDVRLIHFRRDFVQHVVLLHD